MYQYSTVFSERKLKSLIIGVAFSCLSCCAASNASITNQSDRDQSESEQSGTHQSESSRPKVVHRTIDWPAAQRLASRHSDVEIAQNKLIPIRKNTGSSAKLAVPLMLLPANFTSSANYFSAFQISAPLLLQTVSGYTVVYKSAQVDIVIDASNAMMQTAGNRETVQQEFNGQYQQMEGGGGEKTIGRFGALYSVQLMCNKPAIPQCVTEAMLNEVIDGLDVYPASVISQ